MTPEFLTNSSTTSRNSGKNSPQIDAGSNARSSEQAAFQQALKRRSTDGSTEDPGPSARPQTPATESEEISTDRPSATESQPPESLRSRQADRESLSESARRTGEQQSDAPARSAQSPASRSAVSDHSPQEPALPALPASSGVRAGQIRRIDAAEVVSANPATRNPQAASESGHSGVETGKSEAGSDTTFVNDVTVKTGNVTAFDTSDPADVGTLPSLLRRSSDRPVNVQQADVTGDSDVSASEISLDGTRSLHPDLLTDKAQQSSAVDGRPVSDGVAMPDAEGSSNTTIPASQISSTDPFLVQPSSDESGLIGPGANLPENIQFAEYEILPVPTLPSLRSDVTVTAPIRQPVAADEEIRAAVSAALGEVVEENVVVAEARASGVETATPESSVPLQERPDADVRNDALTRQPETAQPAVESPANDSIPLILPSLSAGQKPDSLPRASITSPENPATVERIVIPDGETTDGQTDSRVTDQRTVELAQNAGGSAAPDSSSVTDRRATDQQESRGGETVTPEVRPSQPSNGQIETPGLASTVLQTERGPAGADERADAPSVQTADVSSVVPLTQRTESVTPVRPRQQQSETPSPDAPVAAVEQAVSVQTAVGTGTVSSGPDIEPSEKKIRADVSTQRSSDRPSVVNSETPASRTQDPPVKSTIPPAVSAPPADEFTNQNSPAGSGSQPTDSVSQTPGSEVLSRSESRRVISSSATVSTDIPTTESRENQSGSSAGAPSENPAGDSRRIPIDQPTPEPSAGTRSATVPDDSLTASVATAGSESVTSQAASTEVPETKATSPAQAVSASPPVFRVSEVSGSDPVRKPAIPMEIQDAVSAIQDASGGDQRIRVRLNPRDLGTMLVDVSRTESGIVARMEVESAAARVAILESMPELQRSLNRSGAAVDRIEVVLNESRAESGRQESDQSQQREQQSRQDRQSSGQRQARDEQNQRRQQNQQHNSGNESEASADQPAGHQAADELDIKL